MKTIRLAKSEEEHSWRMCLAHWSTKSALSLAMAIAQRRFWR
jgi:hypothetical protein